MLQSTFIFTTTMTAKENCQKSENWVEKPSDTHLTNADLRDLFRIFLFYFSLLKFYKELMVENNLHVS